MALITFDEFKAALEAALSQTAPASMNGTQGEAEGWKPIETAKKDGTAVLATWPDYAGVMQVGICWNNGTGWYPYNRQATHWMPLPAAPAQGESR